MGLVRVLCKRLLNHLIIKEIYKKANININEVSVIL